MNTISKIAEHVELCSPLFFQVLKSNYAKKYDVDFDDVTNVDALVELSICNPRIFGAIADYYFLMSGIQSDSKLI